MTSQNKNFQNSSKLHKNMVTDRIDYEKLIGALFSSIECFVIELCCKNHEKECVYDVTLRRHWAPGGHSTSGGTRQHKGLTNGHKIISI